MQWQTPQCKPFANATLAKLPDVMRGSFARSHAEKYETDYFQANLSLARLNRLIKDINFGPHLLKNYFDEDKLLRIAESQAHLCKQLALPNCTDLTERFNIIYKVITDLGIEVSDKLKADKNGLVLRSMDDNFWRRSLRTAAGRVAEHLALEGGLVHKKAAVYCSDFAVARLRSMKKRNATLMNNTILTNDEGQDFSLYELSQLSVSNPAIRRAELMTRIRGFEEYAKLSGKAAVFITVTAPSKYHARSYKYNGSTPRDTQNCLNRVWARARAQLARENIEIFGFRVAEPHHDGTPHGHSLLFVEPKQQTRLVQIVRQYAMAEDGGEKGAYQNRVKTVFIDTGKGGAAGYIAKYISKNIDGRSEDGQEFGTGKSLDNESMELEFNGLGSVDNAERICAWASLWGIRQFQQIGGLPVTIWRTLRKIEDSFSSDEEGQAAHSCADSGDWSGFLVNGFKSGLSLVKESDWEQTNLETGEVIKVHETKQNQFGDYTPPKVIGVKCDESGEIITINFRNWQARPLRSRTRVNNCTAHEEALKKIDSRLNYQGFGFPEPPQLH